MINKKLLFVLFFAAVIIQLYIPAGMILEREDTLRTGREFKFKSVPIDPSDPLRGQYVSLDFDNNIFEDSSKIVWLPGEEIFITLSKDMYGFAEIVSIHKEKPALDFYYLKAEVRYVNTFVGKQQVHISYPFDRYYMDEFKAPKAELAYVESLRDTTNITYAIVKVKEGNTVLEDVMINNISLKDLVK